MWVQTRRLPDLDVSFLFVLPSCPFFVLLGTFRQIFPGFSRFIRGFSRFVLFLFVGLLEAPTSNIPKRVRDTTRPLPKNGKPSDLPSLKRKTHPTKLPRNILSLLQLLKHFSPALRKNIQCESKLTECFRGVHRRGRNFSSSLRFSGPLSSCSEMSLFYLKTCSFVKGTP